MSKNNNHPASAGIASFWMLSEARVKAFISKVRQLPTARADVPESDGVQPPGYTITNGIATIPVVGILTKYPMPEAWMDEWCGTCPAREVMRCFQEAAQHADVNAIVFQIDCPGGMVAGTSELVDLIKGYRKRPGAKPVHAVVSDLAASGGYYIASQCETISCNPLGETGCIGVYCVLTDSSKFWEDMGLVYTLVSSGGVKGLGADGKVSEELIEDQRRGVMAIYERFIADVSAGRSISLEQARTLGDGRMWIGSEALEMRLIDSVASVGDAMAAIQMETYRMTLESFNSFAAEHPEAVASFVEQGKKAGMAEGAKQERDRVGSVLKAYGLDSHAAAASIAKGDDADTAQRIAEVAAKARADAEASAATAAAAHKAETERLAKELEKAKFEAQGQGPVGGGRQQQGGGSDAPSGDPKAQAEQEWDSDPATHAGFSSKENYVAFRKAEIQGSHRSFERKPTNAA